MRTQIISQGVNVHGQNYKVVAFFGPDEKFMYTRTYLYDADMYVVKSIRVFTDGTVDVQE